MPDRNGFDVSNDAKARHIIILWSLRSLDRGSPRFPYNKRLA